MPASPLLLNLGYSSVLQKGASGAQLRSRAQVGPGKGVSGPGPRDPGGSSSPRRPHPTPRTERLCHFRRAQDLGRRGTSSRHRLHLHVLNGLQHLGCIPASQCDPWRICTSVSFTLEIARGWRSRAGQGWGGKGPKRSPTTTPAHSASPPPSETRAGQGQGRKPGRVPSFSLPAACSSSTFSQRLRARSCGGAA